MATTAIVPLRSPGRGKTRLQDVLNVDQRARLATAMFDDVIAALRASHVDDIVVSARGARAIEHAQHHGLAVVEDPPTARSLNEALANVLTCIEPADTLLVIAADLPLLTSTDINAVLDHDEAVVIAPTRRGGTGGLVRRPPECMTTGYGSESANRHLDMAATAGIPAAECRRAGFYVDVDVPADLADLHQWLSSSEHRLGHRTCGVLGELAHIATAAQR